MNLTLFWVPLFFGFSPIEANGQPQEATYYCNAEFQFCATYPDSILTFKSTLIQGNGIILKSEDGFVEVTIAGFPQPKEQGTQEIFFSSAREKSILIKEPMVISSLFGEDFYECYFMVGHNLYYQKSFHFDDHFVRVEIKVPINMPDRMPVLRGQISLDFDGTLKVGEKATSSIGLGSMKD